MRIVPAVNGLHWLRFGWLLFMRNPLMWILAFSAVWLMFAVFMQIAYLGVLLVALTLPAFMAGFMTMGAAAEAGRPLEPGLLFAGFRARPAPLITLGGIYFIGVCIVLLVLQWTAGEAMEAAAGDPANLHIGWGDLALPALLFFLLQVAFWFAPTLTAWQAMPPLKALFFSFFSCMRNWRAFLAYGLTLALFLIGGLILSSYLLPLLLGAAVQDGPSAWDFMLAFALGLMPMQLASVYVSYRDIFSPPSQTPAP